MTSAATSAKAGILNFDHVGITVDDIDKVADFFISLGFETEGRSPMEGEFLDTVVGMSDAQTEIVMLRPPGGGTMLELGKFVRPASKPGTPDAPENEMGLRNVAFEVTGLDEILERLAADGYHPIGGVGEYEGIWRMAHVRGPEGLIVALAERIG
jgi:catechol 2,3-dioxygenase-like lactoylglutathione lyase family enzyme